MLRKFFYSIILFALFLILTGCKETTEPINSSVDPIFREFYEILGGKEVLGPVISNMYEENGKKLQFTTSALMLFDPHAAESSRYQLAPLGNAMKVAEPPLVPDSLNGHGIYPGFLPIFHQLGGTRYTGQPLTGVKADPEHNRIIQYFENVGFYQLTTDSPDVAHLLHYGVWKCAYACNFNSPQESIVILSSTTGNDFTDAVDLLDPSFIGAQLTDIYIASDGREEQIFENVVIYSDPSSPSEVALRPLAQLLGIQPDTPSSAGQGDGKFITIEGNQGFNVPYHFDEYIERNNGYEFVGFPINNYNQISKDLYRQCFENLCLEYRANEIDGLQIHPMALGSQYNQQFTGNSSEGNGTNSFDAVTLTVWELYPKITSAEGQEIHVMVLENGKPLKNMDLVLEITNPDGSKHQHNFPPTGNDGQSHLEVSAIKASNGTLILYQVCVENIQDGPDCITEDYLIWGNP